MILSLILMVNGGSRRRDVDAGSSTIRREGPCHTCVPISLLSPRRDALVEQNVLASSEKRPLFGGRDSTGFIQSLHRMKICLKITISRCQTMSHLCNTFFFCGYICGWTFVVLQCRNRTIFDFATTSSKDISEVFTRMKVPKAKHRTRPQHPLRFSDKVLGARNKLEFCLVWICRQEFCRQMILQHEMSLVMSSGNLNLYLNIE